MQLLPLCLLLSHVVHLHWAQVPTDVSCGLECLNDFFYTITCSLNGTKCTSHTNTTNMMGFSWLQARDFEGTHFTCKLAKALDSWGCALYMYVPGAFSFTDEDRYEISLFTSLHGNNSSLVLQPKYRPRKHIKPIPPRNLSMQYVGEDAVFSWRSGYEKRSLLYEEHVRLFPHMRFQLRLVSTHGHMVEYSTPNRNLSVAMSIFSPGSEYLATVRSQPNQIYYRGVWSQWAPTLCWRTANHTYVKSSSPLEKKDLDTSLLTASLISVCLFFMLFIIGYILLVRWKRRAVIPHPTLNMTEWKDERGYLWMVGIPSYEESSKIDTVMLQPIKSGINPCEQLVVVMGNKAQVKSFTGKAGCVQLDTMATEMDRLPCSEDYCTLSSLTA
ncbi:hypothetical protein ACEWY4_026197 [Coilia grayii]|uniref:Fibronectin type-III domain-containing protein n=1 Tax=Coilia grayii TaxID=363190 RepID=A0ABD1IU53_9TELE